MQRLLKKYLPCSGLVLLLACTSAYKSLQPTSTDAACVQRMMPHGIETGWYSTHVDVIGKHLSGLLLIKTMPDQSQRVVFTNEVGITFFDFGFAGDGTFRVHDVVSHMDKKAVVQTLRKDFELLLGIPFRKADFETWKTDTELYIGAAQKKETAYIVTDVPCGKFQRLELGSKRKQKVTIALHGNTAAPDSIAIQHHTFAMTISLKKIER